MQKTNKRVAKTFWRTGSGKLMRRKAGQAHFNARSSGNATMGKRKDLAVAKVDNKLSLVMGK
ncbi:MAG TPA: 50S ribosomal protein L35 [Methylomirabilota bacterium]|jgi:ribosomal protein L35|nr:50S ribosomal protein L35 [Methylomirabilota bacterium]